MRSGRGSPPSPDEGMGGAGVGGDLTARRPAREDELWLRPRFGPSANLLRIDRLNGGRP